MIGENPPKTDHGATTRKGQPMSPASHDASARPVPTYQESAQEAGQRGQRIAGIHHVTAIAGDPQRNLDFYAGVLGLRLVKKTVNFDDPGSYHFYFGDDAGRPGTILTFFPWHGAKRGTHGSGCQTATAFIVPAGSIEYWRDHLKRHAEVDEIATRFGQRVLALRDHDGTSLELIETPDAEVMPYSTGGTHDRAHAIRGFHGATITQRDGAAAGRLLESLFNAQRVAAEGSRTRYRFTGGVSDSVLNDDSSSRAAPSADLGLGRFVDVVEAPDLGGGGGSRLGAGVVHHLALRAADDADQARWRHRVAEIGLQVTAVQDRSYFRSIYFREPQGVLFEIATDVPGFATDESPDTLGEALKLPDRYEPKRAAIERYLPPVTVPRRGARTIGR
jgi:glyoxalase family protein